MATNASDNYQTDYRYRICKFRDNKGMWWYAEDCSVGPYATNRPITTCYPTRRDLCDRLERLEDRDGFTRVR